MADSLTSDVVIIGGGLAGIVCALELLAAKKRVVLLERAPRQRFGGLARWSFGGLFSVDSPEQRRSGIEDSVALAWQDWKTYGEFGSDEKWPLAWGQAFVERCRPDVQDWLRARGVRFFPAVNWTERGYFVPGNSVPRFHLTWGCGQGIVDPLVGKLAAYEKSGALTLCFEHRVIDLVREGGRFVGAHGVVGEKSFEARGAAVVVAAGGLAGSLDKIREHWDPALGKAPADMLIGSFPEADGALLDAAKNHGADITHLHRMWNYIAGVAHPRPLFPGHGLSLVPGKGALWLDARGKRFTDPPLVGSFDTLHCLERVCRTPEQYSWQVMNYKIMMKEFAVSGAEFNTDLRDKKLFAFLARLLFGNKQLVADFLQNCVDFVTASDVATLAAKMNALAGGVDAAVLAEEIARYDENISRPKNLRNDDQFRRIEQCRAYRGDKLRTAKFARIDDPQARPLIAMRLRVVTRKSLGGIVVDLSGRVLDKQGAVMPGLFAAGEAAGFGGGGMHGRRALEGTFLGGCVFSGRKAAEGIQS